MASASFSDKLDLFEKLVQVRAYLQNPEIIRRIHNPHGYDLSQFVGDRGFFDNGAAEKYVESQLNDVRKSLVDFVS